MQIHLNGELHECPDAMSLAALVATLDLAGKRIAVEINGEIAPRSQHVSIILHANDRVEIVQAIGGG
jgi:sulfur carrier protein